MFYKQWILGVHENHTKKLLSTTLSCNQEICAKKILIVKILVYRFKKISKNGLLNMKP